MRNIEHPKRPTRTGQGFPVHEAARLLREGVYLPDYPEALVSEAWRLNYEGAVAIATAAKALQWNAVDGHDENSDVIVSRESWSALQRAIRGGQ